MPRTDFFGKQWRTGEDLALDSTIEALGGVKQMANYWAQYSDKIKEEERKKREEQEKAEAKQLEEEERIRNDYAQIKSLREDIPDELAYYIAQMEKGPYKSALINNAKNPLPFYKRYNPLEENRPLENLINDYNENGFLQPVTEIRNLIEETAQKSGLSPQEIISKSVEEGVITPQQALLVSDSFGPSQEAKQTPTMRELAGSQQRQPTGLMPTGRGMSTSELLRTGVQGLASAVSAPFDWALNAANALQRGRSSLRESALQGWDPNQVDAAGNRGLDIESLPIDESLKQTLREAKGELEQPALRVGSQEFGKQRAQLPTLKGSIEKILPEGYLTPTGEAQKILNDIAGDITTLATPQIMGQGLKKAGQIGLRAAKASGIGNLLKWGAKKVGAGPLVQEGVRLASLLYFGTGIEEGVAKEIKNQFNTSGAIGETTPIQIQPFDKAAKDTLKEVGKGGPGTKAYKAVKDTIENMYDKFLGEGKFKEISKTKDFFKQPLSVAEQESALMTALEEANPTASQMQDFVSGMAERIRDVGGINTSEGKALDLLANNLRQTLLNPANSSSTYVNAYRPAVEGYKQLKDAEKIINWIDGKLPKSGFLTLRSLMLRGAGNIASSGIYKPAVTTVMALKKMATSPQFREAYRRMAIAAAQENISAVVRHATILENQLNQMVEKEKDKAERTQMRLRNLNALMKK